MGGGWVTPTHTINQLLKCIDDNSAHTCNIDQKYDIVDASELAGCHLHLSFAASSLPKTLTSWLPFPRFLVDCPLRLLPWSLMDPNNTNKIIFRFMKVEGLLKLLHGPWLSETCSLVSSWAVADTKLRGGALWQIVGEEQWMSYFLQGMPVWIAW